MGTAKAVKSGTLIIHSHLDDIVPFADAEELVRNSGLPAYSLIEVGNDHWLNDAGSLEMMMGACEPNWLVWSCDLNPGRDL